MKVTKTVKARMEGRGGRTAKKVRDRKQRRRAGKMKPFFTGRRRRDVSFEKLPAAVSRGLLLEPSRALIVHHPGGKAQLTLDFEMTA